MIDLHFMNMENTNNMQDTTNTFPTVLLEFEKYKSFFISFSEETEGKFKECLTFLHSLGIKEASINFNLQASNGVNAFSISSSMFTKFSFRINYHMYRFELEIHSINVYIDKSSENLEDFRKHIVNFMEVYNTNN